MKLYYIIFSLFLFNVSINNSAIDESLEECDLYVIGACFFDDGIYEEYFDDRYASSHRHFCSRLQ